jgi:hypothetical protein
MIPPPGWFDMLKTTDAAFQNDTTNVVQEKDGVQRKRWAKSPGNAVSSKLESFHAWPLDTCSLLFTREAMRFAL